ncbi:MAG: ABC transporter permease [Clostridiales bacterium]|jgi:dipeptide transport system permease protein|nr:ABC transporter permease [Clostridiales bacterium]
MDENKKIMFEPANINPDEMELIKRPSLSYWKDAWIRIRKNKLAMVGLVILTVILFMAIIGPIINTNSYSKQNYDHMQELPSRLFWFGTDEGGRDIFVRLWRGTRVSLFIGIISALLDLVIGVLIGGIAGYKGGAVDDILMRFGEILYSIPYMLTVIIFMIYLGPGVNSMIAALAVTGWVPMSRIVRGEVLKIKELEFVQAAKSFGADTKWILLKHLIPNAMGPIIVNVTLTVPRAIFSEATLSFLGLGVPAPQPSLGVMTSDAVQAVVVGTYYELLFPATVICLLMFSFNVLGDGLRDALDPKLRK